MNFRYLLRQRWRRSQHSKNQPPVEHLQSQPQKKKMQIFHRVPFQPPMKNKFVSQSNPRKSFERRNCLSCKWSVPNLAPSWPMPQQTLTNPSTQFRPKPSLPKSSLAQHQQLESTARRRSVIWRTQTATQSAFHLCADKATPSTLEK